MGKQNHSFPFTGRVDTLSFYQKRDGTHMVRKKTSTGAIFSSEANYQVLQKNRQEFQKAANAGKLMRHALRNPLSRFKDKSGSGRLAKTFLAIVKSDPVNPRGERNFKDGDLNMLKGYEFNPNSQLTRIFRTAFQTNIDRSTGKLTV